MTIFILVSYGVHV